MNLEDFGLVEYHAPIINTYKINTKAKYILHPYTQDDVLSFLQFSKDRNIPYFILGCGSNVVLSDSEFPGVILLFDRLNSIEYDDNRVTVGAGVRLPFLSFDIVQHGLKGLEWASGIPATVGGAIYGNAEAYKVSTFHYLESVTYINQDLEVVTCKKSELSYGYRTSFFKENKGNVILSATFIFPYGNELLSKKLILDRKERRMATQPLEYPSAGSVFRNPSIDNPSWKIIESLGLKGLMVGGAQVSFKHANFIINYANATGKDIRNLIQLIKDKVKEETGIDLLLEQEYLDW